MGEVGQPIASASIAKRFQQRTIELAKQGILGSLRTRKASLQNSYALLMTLLDNPAVPILIFGERGAGKRKHVEELLTAHNFYRRLEGREFGKLKVFKGNFVKEGFTSSFLSPHLSSADLIYLEGVDLLSPACQTELLAYMSLRKKFTDSGVSQPRLVVGTDQSLSLLVLKDSFKRELFQSLTSFAVFLPSLNERSEDLPSLVQSLSEEISGRPQSPTPWLVDLLSRQLWSGNLDDLKKLLKNGLTKNPQLKSWTEAELPQELRSTRKSGFRVETPEDMSEDLRDRTLLKQALLACGGDRIKAARSMNLSQVQLLKKMLVLGLR